jgi:hypothetical protein
MADYGRNVYADYYDSALGLYQYTGEGQQGDQKFLKFFFCPYHRFALLTIK